MNQEQRPRGRCYLWRLLDPNQEANGGGMAARLNQEGRRRHGGASESGRKQKGNGGGLNQAANGGGIYGGGIGGRQVQHPRSEARGFFRDRNAF